MRTDGEIQPIDGLYTGIAPVGALGAWAKLGLRCAGRLVGLASSFGDGRSPPSERQWYTLPE